MIVVCVVVLFGSIVALLFCPIPSSSGAVVIGILVIVVNIAGVIVSCIAIEVFGWLEVVH